LANVAAVERDRLFRFLRGASISGEMGKARLKDWDYAEKMMRRNPGMFEGPDVAGIRVSRSSESNPGKMGLYLTAESMIRSINRKTREIDGFFQLSTETSDGRRVKAHAFDKDIKSFLKSPLLLWDHDRGWPIGSVRQLAFEGKGSWMKAEIFDDKIFGWMMEGRVRGLSWSGPIIEHAFIKNKKTDEIIFEVRRAELDEISAVTIPAHRETVFTEPAKRAKVIRRASSTYLYEDPDADVGVPFDISGGKEKFQVFMPFDKVDEEKREVWGYGCRFDKPYEPPFSDLMEPEAMSKALPEWLEWRNIREMHGGACGTAFHVSVEKKGVMIGVRVSKGAESTWKKIKDGTLKGFSIGGAVLERGKKELNGKTYPTIKECEIEEWSLVDRPAGGKACAIRLVRRKPDGDYTIGRSVADVDVGNEDFKLLGRGKVNNSLKGAGGNVVSASEPMWSSYIRKSRGKLPRGAFADTGKKGDQSSWRYPHHWMNGAVLKLHREALLLAFGLDEEEDSKIVGKFFSYSDEEVFSLLKGHGGFESARKNGLSDEVLAHLQAHRRSIGEDVKGGSKKTMASKAKKKTQKKDKVKMGKKSKKADRVRMKKKDIATKKELAKMSRDMDELRGELKDALESKPKSGRKRAKSNVRPVNGKMGKNRKKRKVKTIDSFRKEDGTIHMDKACEFVGGGIIPDRVIGIGGRE